MTCAPCPTAMFRHRRAAPRSWLHTSVHPVVCVSLSLFVRILLVHASCVCVCLYVRRARLEVECAEAVSHMLTYPFSGLHVVCMSPSTVRAPPVVCVSCTKNIICVPYCAIVCESCTCITRFLASCDPYLYEVRRPPRFWSGGTSPFSQPPKAVRFLHPRFCEW